MQSTTTIGDLIAYKYSINPTRYKHYRKLVLPYLLRISAKDEQAILHINLIKNEEYKKYVNRKLTALKIFDSKLSKNLNYSH